MTAPRHAGHARTLACVPASAAEAVGLCAIAAGVTGGRTAQVSHWLERLVLDGVVQRRTEPRTGRALFYRTPEDSGAPHTGGTHVG